MRTAGKKIEIVFVSSDKDEASFEEYFEMIPWLALPFQE
jgi:nucleoredoxin